MSIAVIGCRATGAGLVPARSFPLAEPAVWPDFPGDISAHRPALLLPSCDFITAAGGWVG
jgi:hypothetical protein